MEDMIVENVKRQICIAYAKEKDQKQRQTHHNPIYRIDFFLRSLFVAEINIAEHKRHADCQDPGDRVVVKKPEVLPHKSRNINKDEDVKEFKLAGQQLKSQERGLPVRSKNCAARILNHVNTNYVAAEISLSTTLSHDRSKAWIFSCPRFPRRSANARSLCSSSIAIAISRASGFTT